MRFPKPSLTTCSICGYDRTAIGSAPRCPECGFPFEEPLKVIRTRPIPIGIALGAAIAAAVIADGLLMPTLRDRQLLTVRETWILIGLIFDGVLALLVICPLGTIGIGRTGVATRNVFRCLRWIPYTEIEVRHRSRGVYSLREKTGGPLRLPTGGMFWRKRMDIQTQIARQWAQARTDAAGALPLQEPSNTA